MNLWGKLLGSTDVIKGGKELIDDAFHTEEERATHFLALLTQYETYKVAQRYAMLLILTPFIGTFCISVVLYTVVIILNLCGLVLSTSHIDALMNFNIDTLGLAASIVVGFYFGGGAVEGAVRRWKGGSDAS